MGKITENDIRQHIETHIPDFHRNKLQKLENLRLKEVLLRKNPYLFRAKNVTSAGELVKSILDAYLSSQEESVFGGFLETLAIFICGRVYGGRESAAEGIDLEFEKDGLLFIVSIKSGPNWGNSSQINKMKDNFRKAKRVLGTHAAKQNIVAINGCCYGRDASQNKLEYTKLCGQSFWAFISGNDSLYKDIIEPLGHRAKECNEQFATEYGKVVNRFTREFISDFCQDDGAILWPNLVEFNSSSKKPDSPARAPDHK